MGELAAERRAVKSVIEQLHLTPVLFELGARPHPPRELYLAYLRQSDVFVGIYGEQYGWVAQDATTSGIEDEYLAASGKPKLIYIRDPAPGRDGRLAAMLERIGADGLSYRFFRDAAELESVVADDLAVLLSERFAATTGDAGAAERSAPGRLPASPNRFVGRIEVLAQLRAVLDDPGYRLVSLVGPGGIGKTRLALRLAADVEPAFADGVRVVMLAATRTAELVPEAIRAALGLSESYRTSTVDHLCRYLSDRELLVVLDNFEHVVDAAPLITDLLNAAHRLSVLVTSRERLRVSTEYVFVVPPLDVPVGDEPRDALMVSEGVELFVERARAVRQDLDIGEKQLRVVAQIVRRLEGLPLAIELAAARVRMLDPADILERLDHRLGLLTRGSRDVPERHRTLRTTIQWSYDLLAHDEQVLFARLGVFVGGFALDSVEAICSPTGDADVLDRLASLVDRSLITPAGAASGIPRFAMLETIREFAVELLANNDFEALSRRHAEHFLNLTLELEPGYERSEEVALVSRLTAEHENLRTALDWLIEHGEPGKATRLAVALWRFWRVRSLDAEGIGHMTRALEHRERLTNHELAQAEFVRGQLAFFGLSDYEHAIPALEAALEGFATTGDDLGVAQTLVPLGVIDSALGTNDGETRSRRAVELAAQLDNTWTSAFATLGYGSVLVALDRAAEARPLLVASVEHARAIGTEVLLSFSLVYLGRAHLALGELEDARAVLREALERATHMESRDPMARTVEALADFSLSVDDPERAALLFGAAEAVRRSTGAPLWEPDQPAHDRIEQALRARLGAERYGTAYAAGASLSFEETFSAAQLA
jgi:predicted ATPase